ncbi:selenocysteine synthase, partial [Acidobacteriota bacterium]
MRKEKMLINFFILFFLGVSLCGFLSCDSKKSKSPASRDYFAELNVPTFIDAGWSYSSRGGIDMWPEVVEAIQYASTRKVYMKELHDAVGSRIAELVGCEAAMVSAGATSAMTVGTAACMTGNDKDLIHQLPDSQGMKDEVIIQKAHHYIYEHAVRCCGAKVVEVETKEELEKSINSQTAMLLFFYARNHLAQIKAE